MKRDPLWIPPPRSRLSDKPKRGDRWIAFIIGLCIAAWALVGWLVRH
jgi:hypothetical protein